TPIHRAATGPASPTASCSTSSSRSRCSAAAPPPRRSQLLGDHLRRRRDAWTALGPTEPLRRAALGASDRLFGLELAHRAVDGSSTKAPCGGQTAGPSPVDRRKQGRTGRWPPTRAPFPLAAAPAPAHPRAHRLAAGTP